MKKQFLMVAVAVPVVTFNASAFAGSFTELDTWRAAAMSCGQGLQGLSEGGDWSRMRADFTDCMVDDAVRLGWDAATDALNAQGKRRFGVGFSLRSRLRHSVRSDAKVLGDLDLLLPLRRIDDAANDDGEAFTAHAFFMQNGITRWTDSHGFLRNDARFGLVHRARTGQGIFGSSLLLQQNRERGHERLAAGLDYVGRWGSGKLTWYAPQTRWRIGRFGYEERALGGAELDWHLTPSDAIGLNLAAGRWDNRDGIGDDELHLRLGLQWRPHSWLRLSGEWREIDGGDASHQLLAKLEIPLGGGARTLPRWHGFGVARQNTAGESDLWRGVDARRIEVAERKVQTSPPVPAPVDGVSVRFLQAMASSGSDIRVEVSLPAPAEADMPLRVQLQAFEGDGAAAEAGVDFADAPTRVTIRAGESSAIATISLLNNARLSESRALGVTVRAG